MATALTLTEKTRLDEVTKMADELFALHGIIDWSFAFDRAVSRLGQCVYARRRITISKMHALHSPIDEVRDTLLHEIAHVLAGPGNGHGPVWQRKVRSIGGKAKARASSRIPAEAMMQKTARKAYVMERIGMDHVGPVAIKRECKAQVGDRINIPRPKGGMATIVRVGQKNFTCAADNGITWRVSFGNAERYLVTDTKHATV